MDCFHSRLCKPSYIYLCGHGARMGGGVTTWAQGTECGSSALEAGTFAHWVIWLAYDSRIHRTCVTSVFILFTLHTLNHDCNSAEAQEISVPPGRVEHTCNPLKAGGGSRRKDQEAQGHPWLHRGLKASSGYKRPCLKLQQPQQIYEIMNESLLYFYDPT